MIIYAVPCWHIVELQTNDREEGYALSRIHIFAIQAGREIRIMVKPEVIKDEGMVLVARDIVKRIENALDYPGQVNVNLIRESRAIDFAK